MILYLFHNLHVDRLYCAIENAVAKFAQSLDTTEAIEVETTTIDGLAAAVRDGRIGSGSQVAAAYIALDHIR